jgi:DNA-binding NarL/FixJ family response regulator
MLLLVGIGISLLLIYVNIDKLRINNLSIQIRKLSEEQPKNSQSKLAELTTRQKEVYDLILLGKSNKEIMTELFIEQSTLKSHINQIYKKLEIKSRRELKSDFSN